MINQIKYIAIYEAFPVCSINYYAKIKNIEYVQNKGKYCFYLSGKPIKIKPIIFEKNHMTFRGFKYTKLKTLLKAKRMSDI